MPTHSNISLTVMQQDRGLLGVTCSLFNQTHSRATLALMLLTAESSSNKSVKTVIIKNYNIFRFIREAQKKAQSPATVTGNKNKNKNTTISSPSSIIIYILLQPVCAAGRPPSSGSARGFCLLSARPGGEMFGLCR